GGGARAGEGWRRFYHPLGGVPGQRGGHPGGPAKTADPNPAGNGPRSFGSPGKRGGQLQRIAKSGAGATRQRHGLGGASKDQQPLGRHPPTRARKLPWRSTIATSIAVLPHNVASATSRDLAATVWASACRSPPASARISAA